MVELRGARVVLRDFVPEDAAAMVPLIADPAVHRFTLWQGPVDADATERFVAMCMAEASRPERRDYTLAVLLSEDGTLVGTAGIRVEDPFERVGSLRGMGLRDRWGQGLGTDVATTLVRFGFDALGLSRIYAHPSAGNAAVHRLLENVGLRETGRGDTYEGHKFQFVQYSITREEWERNPSEGG